MNTSFQAYVVTENAPKQFTRAIQTRSIEDLPAGEVLIRVAYSSLNYKDALSASGNRGVTRKFPHTPGIDAAGSVAASTNPAFAVGDQVVVIGYDLGMNTAGGYGQYIRVPAGWVVKLPQRLTPREAMIYGTAGFTAAMSVDQLVGHGVAPSDGEILVTGATGGVGSMAVALLAQLGYDVVAATGKVATAGDFLRGLGASRIVTRDDVTNVARPMQRPRWAGVVDTVGGPMLETALASTKMLGVVTVCGLVASAEIHTTVFPFILR
ncbi:MAG TPA: acryloyl-CoA reductase, partial [Anaerolineae bacterium]|nr:acryloyl-CoA reductase [Anaerolineae bacterium]